MFNIESKSYEDIKTSVAKLSIAQRGIRLDEKTHLQ